MTPHEDKMRVPPVVPDLEYEWTPGNDPADDDSLAEFFHSRPIRDLKEQMVEMGRRMWQRFYTDGNGGNLTVRVGENLVLCTPTLISKGFMTPEDMCLVDLDGKQVAGFRKRTSEVMTHIAIMKAQPMAKACCHAHPPYATAFSVANHQPADNLIPEAVVFLGSIGWAAYRTPGSEANASEVGRVAREHMSVIMQNHGVITWGSHIEDAYWKMENTEAYCQMIAIAKSLSPKLTEIAPDEMDKLMVIRRKLGMDTVARS